MTIEVTKKPVQIDARFYHSPIFQDYYWYISSYGYVAGEHKRTRKTVMMHRLVLGVTDPKMLTDHKNGIRTDNRRRNLRPCTFAQNNYHKTKTSSGKYRNVVFYKGGWHVFLRKDRKFINGGRFKDVAKALVRAAQLRKEMYGEWA